MDLQLTGKTALVTGASKGIGLATAQALAEEGVRVVGAARTITPELEKVAAATISVDLSTNEGATSVVTEAIEAVGKLDFLVNNVGAGDAKDLTIGSILDVPDKQWVDFFNLNVFSAIWTTKAALPSILEQRGAIINVSTINTRLPAAGPVAYSEAKAALTAFSKRLSEEVGPQGVRVNTVSPGVTASPLWRDPESFGGAFAKAMGVSHEALLAAIPGQFGITSGRMNEPEEVAALIAYLLSEKSANIIGSDIVIDGGMLKTI